MKLSLDSVIQDTVKPDSVQVADARGAYMSSDALKAAAELRSDDSTADLELLSRGVNAILDEKPTPLPSLDGAHQLIRTLAPLLNLAARVDEKERAEAEDLAADAVTGKFSSSAAIALGKRMAQNEPVIVDKPQVDLMAKPISGSTVLVPGRLAPTVRAQILWGKFLTYLRAKYLLPPL